MATTDEIVKAATDLGKLIATHEATKKFEQGLKAVEGDVAAQRALNDYNRHLTKLGEKEAQGKPIEVEEKRQLERLQDAVVQNAVLRAFQVAQMDYLDLMRKVDEAMTGSSFASGGGPAEPVVMGAPPPPKPS